ncbi:hypothetical protein GCM10010300_03390 [Streptomyces olivaceoviridis]|nr:hypothetical protein GCM10010300_03390 [Streptomyces olivaceoviridis]
MRGPTSWGRGPGGPDEGGAVRLEMGGIGESGPLRLDGTREGLDGIGGPAGPDVSEERTRAPPARRPSRGTCRRDDAGGPGPGLSGG